MARKPALIDVRGDLERPRRAPFAVDKDRALNALRRRWGRAHQMDVDGAGWWWALRGDGLKAVSGDGPDALLAAICENYAARPVRLR
jgi:hypothetical protein